MILAVLKKYLPDPSERLALAQELATKVKTKNESLRLTLDILVEMAWREFQ